MNQIIKQWKDHAVFSPATNHKRWLYCWVLINTHQKLNHSTESNQRRSIHLAFRLSDFYKNKLSTVPHYPDCCFFLFCCWVFLPYPLNRHFLVLCFSPMVSTIPHKSTNWVVLTQAFGCLLKKKIQIHLSTPAPHLPWYHHSTIGWPLIISHKTWANWNFYISF